MIFTIFFFHFSHGHMDHISAVPQHIKKRELSGQKPATYYVPPHLVSHLKDACHQFDVLSENSPALSNPHIQAVQPGDRFKVISQYPMVTGFFKHNISILF